MTCSDRAFAIFCETWGEWKCSKKHQIVHRLDAEDCNSYKLSRGSQQECHCKSCMERRGEKE